MNLEHFIVFAGILQLGILVAGALTPWVMDWRTQLARLVPLLRQLVWVYGGFIMLMITSFGLLSLAAAADLASGGPLARMVCGMVAVFWSARLGVQLLVFDARPYLTRWPLFVGYHGLTVSFGYLVAVFGWAALA